MSLRHWWWPVFLALAIALVALVILSQHARSQIRQPFPACPSLDAIPSSKASGNSMAERTFFVPRGNKHDNYAVLHAVREEAIAHVDQFPSDGAIIAIPAGDYVISPPPDSNHCLNVEGLRCIRFQGEGMDRTRLVFESRKVGKKRYQYIQGGGFVDLAFADLELTSSALSATQGTFIGFEKATRRTGWLTIDIDPGYPSIGAVYDREDLGDEDGERVFGRYLREYSLAGERAQDHDQVPWCKGASSPDPEHLGGRRWRIWTRSNLPFQPSAHLAVKSKHGGGAYMLGNGDGLTFERVRWRRSTRGAIINCVNVRFSDWRCEPDESYAGTRPVLASSGGGPQIHARNGFEVRGVRIERGYCKATGDDGCALFGVAEAVVEHNYFEDCFAGGLCTYGSNVVDIGNENVRCARKLGRAE